MPTSIPTRILALATNPETGASTRFRVLQWRPVLEAAGFQLSLDTFFSLQGARSLYAPGRLAPKVADVVSGAFHRWRILTQAHQRAELLFIHREAFPLGRRVGWKALEQFPGPVIYDYDDAMFLPQRQGRGFLARLEDLETPNAIMQRSHVVFAGNRFLADYARQYARRVVLLPTCIDTQRFTPSTTVWDGRRPLIVGWIGSHSTAKYLRSLRPVLERVARAVPFRLYVVGCPERLRWEGIEVEQREWNLASEVSDFQQCDVGIYPLWNDPWAQGKCGFKAIQFMACGVPIVAAAVGANQEIIQDGVNGYLASTEEDWVQKLQQLLSTSLLRAQFGVAGQETIEARYSLRAHASTLIAALREASDAQGDTTGPMGQSVEAPVAIAPMGELVQERDR